MRNPLNSIKLLLALLAEDIAAGRQEVQGETLQTLEYEIGKLTRFTEEFLTWSRPASAVREMIDPAALVHAVVDLAQREARERGVELFVEATTALPSLAGDRQRLEQALLNLVINAIQASGNGGRVIVAATPSGQEGIDIVVVDSGPGVLPEHRERLFEPFFTDIAALVDALVKRQARLLGRQSHGVSDRAWQPCWLTTGLATCANCRTSSSVPPSSPAMTSSIWTICRRAWNRADPEWSCPAGM